MSWRFVVVLLGVILGSCRGTGLPNEGCTHLARRCFGDEIQVCSTDHAWLHGQNCAALRPVAKTCGAIEGRLACVERAP